ncbi:phage tail-collar fiber domain-containing protein [Vibrio rumoiensis]|uniref:Phage tail protein n=1 Tax=Vibrio rumoiensis TaxID=76258 RepID=A0ABW7IZX7_9VIBR
MADLRCYLTTAGIAAENNAKQFGTTLKITEMVFDGTYLADEQNPENLTDVINPVLTVPCSTSISDDGQTLTFKGSILVEQGGFNVWGIGLKTDSGVLYGYARSKGDKILTEDEGATESVRYAVDIITKNADVIEIKINQSAVYADLEDVDNAIKAHEAKPDPHPQYIQWDNLVGFRFHESIHGFDRTQIALKGDGTEVLRADFPKLWAIAESTAVDQALIDANPTLYAANYGTGDGATTFTMPNYGLMPWEAAAGMYGAAGTTVDDQIQNVEGDLNIRGFNELGQLVSGGNGALRYKSGSNTNNTSAQSNIGQQSNIYFDASLSARTGAYTRPKTNFSDVWIIHGEQAA